MLVLAELHGHLLRHNGPAKACELVRSLMSDAAFDWIEINDPLARAAVDSWMIRFSDQAFSLTDAVTFEVMRREHINVAFAFDKHFLVAGYRLLG